MDANNVDWMDGMTPISSKGDLTEIKADDSEGPPKEVGKPDVEAEGAAYWQRLYEETKSRADDNAKYSALIQHMESNSDLVDVLERHIAGEIVDRNPSVFDEDEDYEDFSGEPAPTPTPKNMEEEVRQAEARGAEVARQQERVKFFMKGMLDSGVPDHAVDHFMQLIKNPSMLDLPDLFEASESIRKREMAKVPNPAPEKETGSKPMGSPVAAMSGVTDRPDTETFHAIEDGHNYIPDANSALV